MTAAERSQIEAQDAKWARPPQAFIDRWNTRAGQYGCYNEDTGYFDLNGITDIDYAEALRIDAVSTWPAVVAFGCLTAVLARDLEVRTVFPFFLKSNDTLQLDFFAAKNPSIEALRFVGEGTMQVTSVRFAFYSCTIEGILNIGDTDTASAFSACLTLQEVRLRSLKKNINLDALAGLSLDSISFMVTNAANTSPITITLHPDAYARVTEEIFALAAGKNITIAST